MRPCAYACIHVHVRVHMCARVHVRVVMPITPEVKAKVGYIVRVLMKGRREEKEGERATSVVKDPNSPAHTQARKQVSGRGNPGPQPKA